MAATFTSIDEYIASFPDDVQGILQRVRGIIHQAMPGAGETISYNMPTIINQKRRVYFAAWKKHLALYAVPPLGGELEARVAPYRSTKDTVQFPYKQAVPYDLIEQIVAVLVDR